MKLLLPLMLVSALLLAQPVLGEDDPQTERERTELIEKGRQLIQQGSADYERLRTAMAALEEERARASGAGASLGALDQLAKRATLLQTDISELHKARERLEDAKSRLVSGRLEAAKQAFNDASARWAQVHQRIVTHIGEAPRRPARTATPSPADGGEVAALRREVQALRDEVKALRAEVASLKAQLER